MSDTIRKYQDDDLSDLMSAWESASQLAHPFLTAEFQDQVRHDIPNLYLPNAETWVTERDGVVIGFLSLIGNEIGAIFVHTKHHGTGAGRALMEKAMELHDELEVEVFTQNSIGREFYSKAGFELMNESLHEPTGEKVLRLKFTKS